MVRDRRIAVPRPVILCMVWMIYYGHMVSGDECGPNFMIFVLRLRETPGTNLNQEIDPTGDRTRAHSVRSNDVALCMYACMYILLFLWFLIGDHCSCFSDDRFQLNTAILKSDGSDVFVYILCTWWSDVLTTKTCC